MQWAKIMSLHSTLGDRARLLKGNWSHGLDRDPISTFSRAQLPPLGSRRAQGLESVTCVGVLALKEPGCGVEQGQLPRLEASPSLGPPNSLRVAPSHPTGR